MLYSGGWYVCYIVVAGMCAIYRIAGENYIWQFGKKTT